MRLDRRLIGRCVLGVLALTGAAAFAWWYASQPSPAQAAYLRGKALEAEHRSDEAGTFYAEAIRLDPRFAPPYRALCEIAAARGQIPEAIDFCKQYLAREPKAVHGWCRLADLEMRAHLYASALRDAEHELQLAPACPQAHLIAGLLYERRSEGPSAIDHLSHAAAAYPHDARVLRAYGRVLALAEHYDQAIPVLQQAVTLDPERAEPYRWLGYAYARLPSTPETERRSEAYLRQALRLRPEYPEANFELARLYLNRRQVAEALPYAEKAVHFRKHYQQALYVLWHIDLALGRHEDAARCQKQFQRESTLETRRTDLISRYKLDPTRIQTALDLAKTLQAHDEPELAAHYLVDALQHHPNDPRLASALEAIRPEADPMPSAPSSTDQGSQ